MDWANFPPPGEQQIGKLGDTFGCAPFSAIHCIESQEIQQTGSTPGYSERALAKLSGTIYTGPIGLRGNNAQKVYNAIVKYGLILDRDWPSEFTDAMTVDEFYAEIPQAVLDKAVRPKISLKNSSANFSLAPVWCNIPGHMVEQLNQTQYFDSYKQYMKMFTPSDTVLWQGQLILNPRSKRMLVFFQVKGSQTIWSLMDGEWVGFADPTAFNNYAAGRPNTVIELDQVEFDKLTANPDVFKS